MMLGACFCGQPATRTLAAVGYCEGCHQAILRPIRQRVARRHAIGIDLDARNADLARSRVGMFLEIV